MSSITIYLKDGTVKQHPHQGRPGGSYTKRIRYEGNFVIITDEWGHETAYPSDKIEKVEVEPVRW